MEDRTSLYICIRIPQKIICYKMTCIIIYLLEGINRFAESTSDIRACLYLAVGQPEYLSRRRRNGLSHFWARMIMLPLFFYVQSWNLRNSGTEKCVKEKSAEPLNLLSTL